MRHLPCSFSLVKKYEVEFNKAALSLAEGMTNPQQKKAALNRLLKVGPLAEPPWHGRAALLVAESQGPVRDRRPLRPSHGTWQGTRGSH